MTTCPYGFRILGATSGERRLIDSAAAFRGYAACDPRAEPHREAYLSAFSFGDDFRQLLDRTGSVKGFDGPCWAPYLWWDIDREGDAERALTDARRLVMQLQERYGLDDDDLLAFFSGSKGFHVGLPTCLWQPEPSADFARTTRRFAEGIAAGVTIDRGVYDKVQAFRAPNSCHPKTGLHKRHLTFDELMGLTAEGIARLAEHAAPFDLPTPPTRSDRAAADWREAAEAKPQSRPAGDAPRLNRQTLNFIREGAAKGDRHRLLFSAAANLAEFGCPPALAHALLTEPALDSGLPPGEVCRQIDCGLSYRVPTLRRVPRSTSAAQTPPRAA